MPNRILRSLLALALLPAAPAQIRTLIVDGQNNHDWKTTTPVLQRLLEQTGRFQVEVATSPAKKEGIGAFAPEFAKYKLVVLNYNGQLWQDSTREAFLAFVRNGGGVVIYHAADNSFPEWSEYNQIIGVGGWNNRTGAAGHLVRWRDGKTVREETPGNTGHHGGRKPFLVTIRDPKHPIVKGLPAVWMHAEDELYDSLRGPAQQLDVLATALSSKDNKGTGENEPMLMAIRFGKGRIFHTTMGHDLRAMSCTGFIATYQRGAEWAATGKVTQRVPADFPKADQPTCRTPFP
ncbi:conserved exported hypothetical protein [Candidatus Sulfopaludibacter sp. SbA3]|nr:conserved exported hypothetical protein [Candidatus Sulfopaludibacter sp. SbA3]